MSDFTYLSTFLKHRVFKEEKEVRLLASRIAREKIAAARQISATNVSPEKPTHFRTKNGIPIRFIKLFETLDRDLPITCVVVGPGDGKQQMARAAEKLLAALNVPVSISDIPLR